MAEITFKNRAQIALEQGFLDRIFELANLPSSKILLIFHDSGIGKRYAGTIPKSLIKYAKSLSIFDLYNTESWDCWVMLDRETCEHKNKYPAYFTYLLGHELGHAFVCLTDLKLHIFGCLIGDFFYKVSDKISYIHELPDEKLFDQFGIYIAENLFSRDNLNKEIKELLDNPNRNDHKRLEAMLSLPSTNVLNNLKSELISLAKPYKDKLIELWKENVEKRNGDALASEIDDFETLFEE